MKIITTKTQNPKDESVRTPEEQRFSAAWQRVIAQQEENEQFRDHVRAFAEQTIHRLEEKETAYVDALYNTCLHLLDFLTKKSLTKWQRETIIEWVNHYLLTMGRSAFSAHLDLSVISTSLERAINHLYFPHDTASPFDEVDNFENEQLTSHDDDDTDQTADFSPDEEDDIYDYHAHLDKLIQEFYRRQQEEFNRQQFEKTQAIKQLIKSSSINRLFRKIAAVLHPDKETDESQREQKNSLMSELIQARKNNNILRIFELYNDYVGGSPLKELGENLDSASELLERQYNDLLNMKTEILRDDPRAGSLYQQFHRKSAAATSRAINKHLKEIVEKTEVVEKILHETTSIRKLKPYLEIHYDLFFRE